MNREDLLKEISIKNDAKIILLVLDGLGDLPMYGGMTALEAANTPHFDDLVRMSECGLADPIAPGITPGSGPAHLGIFGYDPLRYQIGRGVLEALGIGMELGDKDLALRGNFATTDKNGVILDRRAGRISTDKNLELCKKLQENIREIDGVEVIIKTVKEHRMVAVFRGDGLEDGLTDTDPQQVGKKWIPVKPLREEAKKAADILNKFVNRVNEILKDEEKANTILLRGIAKVPKIPKMQELFKLNPVAIANYPMYKGLARLVGMDVVEVGDTIEDEFKKLEELYDRYDFFYVHIKKTDSYGEDGSFWKKVSIIEEVDKFIPRMLSLKPDVVLVTGDHSTPALLKSHSWHPVPVVLYSKYGRKDDVEKFSESMCAKGVLGRIRAMDELPLMMACSLKLTKYGA